LDFKDWFNSQESSAFTRRRKGAADGLYPPIADIMSRSTPGSDELKKSIDNLEDSKKKKKKKKDICEGKARTPDYSFDSFVAKAKSAKEELDQDVKKADQYKKDLEEKSKAKEEEEDEKEDINLGGAAEEDKETPEPEDDE
jgi:hypothetical protein